MLSTEELRVFLNHPDFDIRHEAVRILGHAHDRGGVNAEDLWAVLDQRGWEETPEVLKKLRLFPLTDASLTRTLSALRAGVPAEVWHELRELVVAIPFALLQRRMDDLRAHSDVILPADLEHFELRLALADVSAEVLLAALLDYAQELGEDDGGFVDRLRVNRLVEALAREPEVIAGPVLELLKDETITDWREIFAVELAGRARLTDAIDLLIERLRVNAEELPALASDALVAIGDPSIPRRLTAHWDKEGDGFRLFASDTLERLHFPESETVAREIFVQESGELVGVFHAHVLLSFLPGDSAVLQQVYDYVREIPPGLEREGLDGRLATVATMVGWDFPDRAAWRREGLALLERLRSADEGSRTAEARRALMISGASAEESWEKILPELENERPEDEESAPEEGPGTPFVREVSKIGRNDQCPCGSGKKYKKCCGKNG